MFYMVRPLQPPRCFHYPPSLLMALTWVWVVQGQVVLSEWLRCQFQLSLHCLHPAALLTGKDLCEIVGGFCCRKCWQSGALLCAVSWPLHSTFLNACMTPLRNRQASGCQGWRGGVGLLATAVIWGLLAEQQHTALRGHLIFGAVAARPADSPTFT